jgi:hypothetical protein
MSSQITETSTIVASHYDAVSATAESLEFSDDTIALATTALQYGILSDAQPGDADTDAAHAATDQSDVDNAPHALSAKLAHLVDSVTEVEELSRRAREAAVDDLARYESLAASTDQYGRGLEQARAICVQVRETRDNSFGQAAKAAAEELVAEAEQVLAAFTQLVAAWKAQENSFLATHPDVDLLVAERQALEVEARRQEAVAALARRRDALLASVDAALEEQVLPEARRALAVFEREFPDDLENIRLRRERLQQGNRAEKDLAARQALLLSGQHQAAGDLEAALATLEQVDVHGLSLDVSEDIFGRWCDACSRLAQTTGAWLVRFAPAQGRGLILLKDPSRPQELQVFSSLGMGSDYPNGVMITPFLDEHERRDPVARKRAAEAPNILRRAREFREATMQPMVSWGSFAASSPAAPVHH